MTRLLTVGSTSGSQAHPAACSSTVWRAGCQSGSAQA